MYLPDYVHVLDDGGHIVKRKLKGKLFANPLPLVGVGLLGGMLLATGVEAATYYVATNGNNSNSCSQAQNASNPKKTISSGVNCMSSGDTVRVKSGTYSESFGNDFPGGSSWSNVTTLEANPGDTVIVKPNGGNRVFEFNNSSQKYIEINGFIIDAANVGYNGVKIEGGAHHIRFKDVEVKNAPDQGIKTNDSSHHLEFINVNAHHTAWGKACHGSGNGAKNGYCHGLYISSHDTLVEGGELHHNNGLGIQFYPGPDNPVIRGVRVYDNASGTGAIFFGSGGSGGMAVNNVVYNNPGDAIVSDRSGVEFYNNTVYDNGSAGIRIKGGNNHKVRNNILYNNGSSINNGGSGTTMSHNLTSNPQFMNASNDDFHIKDSSPAIDAGMTLASDVPTDFEGNSRPQGGDFDIGAYEFGGEPGDNDPPAPPENLEVVSHN